MDFKSLSNKELHKKCLEHGLPNSPVTDSSRNVILKRLEAALNPSALTKSSKRQKSLSTPTAKPTNQNNVPKLTRHTINIPAALTTLPTNRKHNKEVRTAHLSNESEEEFVRVIATPPRSNRKLIQNNNNIELRRTVPMVIDNDRNDDNYIYQSKLYPDLGSLTQSFNNDYDVHQSNRSSRSSSLSRGEVVTTSYTHEIEPAQKLTTYAEYEDEDDDETNYLQPEFERRHTVDLQNSSNYSSMYNRNYNNVPSSNFNSAHKNTGIPKTDLNFKNNRPQNKSNESRFSNNLYCDINYDDNEDNDSEFTSEENDDGNTIEQFNTPYLSKYVKTLNKLKAEQIPAFNKNITSISGSIIPRTTVRSSNDHPKYRQNFADQKDICFNEMFRILDQKYKLTFYLTVIFVLIMAIFIYVLFT